MYFDSHGGSNGTPSGFIEYRLKSLRVKLKCKKNLLKKPNADKPEDLAAKNDAEEDDENADDMENLVGCFY